MSRLFKSNWGVAILVCCAVYVVVSNVVLPLVASPEDFEDIPFLDHADMGRENAGENLPLKAVNTSKLYWNDAPARDPFGDKHSIEKTQITEIEKIRDRRETKIEAKSARKSIAKKRYSPVPVMTGFVAGIESKFVVLNNQVMTEGQSIDDYLVVAITKHGVDLRHPDGLSAITLTVAP